MDYEPYDSSGTDDDLPPSHQNRISGGGCVAGNGNGRSAMASVPHSRMYGETDMETQIHQLEQEAYTSVLRAFKAQADLITWEKESLITELRKELRLSNEEHKELLGRVNSDDVIRRIREWRQAAGIQPGLLSSCQAVHDSILSPTVSLSHKKQKVTQSVPSQSFGGPSPPFHPQAVAASHQPSTSTAKRGLVPVPKGKKQNHILPNTSSVKQYTSSGPPGRGQAINRLSSNAIGTEPAEGSTFDSLIGRKVRTRWPDDNNFYEAVITDYNKTEGLHALIYDIGSSKETWEWVKLSEILPKDIQWVGEDTGISHCGGYSRSGHEMNRSVGHDNIPAAGRSKGVRKGQPRKDFLTSQNGVGKKVPDDIRIHRSVGHDSIPAAGRSRGVRKGQPRKDFLTSQNGVGKKVPDDIRIHNTDTLIKEVERVFGANHPDPLEIEKTKKVLKEHEQALIDAIAKLSHICDGGESGLFQPILCHSS